MRLEIRILLLVRVKSKISKLSFNWLLSREIDYKKRTEIFMNELINSEKKRIN